MVLCNTVIYIIKQNCFLNNCSFFHIAVYTVRKVIEQVTEVNNVLKPSSLASSKKRKLPFTASFMASEVKANVMNIENISSVDL